MISGKDTGTRHKMKHYILVKWNSKFRENEQNMQEIRDIFSKTLNIEGVHKVEIIKNVINRENRYDLLIRLDMNKESLTLYDISEPHKEWKEKFSSFIDSKAIFDSEE